MCNEFVFFSKEKKNFKYIVACWKLYIAQPQHGVLESEKNYSRPIYVVLHSPPVELSSVIFNTCFFITTLPNSMGPHTIRVGWWELSLHMNIPTQLFVASDCYISRPTHNENWTLSDVMFIFFGHLGYLHALTLTHDDKGIHTLINPFDFLWELPWERGSSGRAFAAVVHVCKWVKLVPAMPFSFLWDNDGKKARNSSDASFTPFFFRVWASFFPKNKNK